MVFNNVSVWLVSDAACCAKGQSGDGVGRLRVRWHTLAYAEHSRGCSTGKEKRSPPQPGISNSWVFQSAYVQFLIMCRFQSSSPAFHACTQISLCRRETSGHLWERLDVLLTILSPQAQARGLLDILSVHLVCLGNTCAPESSSQALLR